ncbi:hypothetical protein AHAS_Ahas01G0111400 [Arachis hypogaea]
MGKKLVFWVDIGGWGDLPSGGAFGQHAGGVVLLLLSCVSAPQQHARSVVTRRACKYLAPRKGVVELALRSLDVPALWGGVLQLLSCKGQVSPR